MCFPKKIKGYKGKKYSEWYCLFNNELEKYKIKLDGLDEYVYLVNEEDVIKKYDSIDFIKNKKYLNLKYGFKDYVLEIVESISNFFNISSNDIGIEGSILLDCYNKNSDIDLLVFGKDNAKKIQEKFYLFDKYNNVSLFSDTKAEEYVNERLSCGFGNNIKSLKKQFLRRYYGYIYNKQFSIVCVPYENEDGYINLNRKVKFSGIYEGIITITDDDNSCIIPSIYSGVDNDGNEYLIEIYNHYGINQVKKDEKVFVKGKKYKDCSNGNNIIILSFWSGIEERFDLYE